MLTHRKVTVFLFVLLLLTAPWEASAARIGAPRHSPQDVEAPLPALLSRTWVALTRLWAKNGCGADPDGRCSPTPAPAPSIENGCGADPNGRCAL